MLLPGLEDGYEIVKVPESYKPDRKRESAYSSSESSQSYQMPDVETTLQGSKVEGSTDLPPIKPE